MCITMMTAVFIRGMIAAMQIPDTTPAMTITAATGGGMIAALRAASDGLHFDSATYVVSWHADRRLRSMPQQ
jgi:hypothetical protein